MPVGESGRPILNREIFRSSGSRSAEYPRSKSVQENVGVGKCKCQVRGAEKMWRISANSKAKGRRRIERSRRTYKMPGLEGRNVLQRERKVCGGCIRNRSNESPDMRLTARS
jgi:hypothetical protein